MINRNILKLITNNNPEYKNKLSPLFKENKRKAGIIATKLKNNLPVINKRYKKNSIDSFLKNNIGSVINNSSRMSHGINVMHIKNLMLKMFDFALTNSALNKYSKKQRQLRAYRSWLKSKASSRRARYGIRKNRKIYQEYLELYKPKPKPRQGL